MVTLANDALIPTRTALAAQKHEGRADLLDVGGDGLTVVSASYVNDRFRPENDRIVDTKRPAHLRLEEGVPGRDEVAIRFILHGHGEATITFDAEKGGHREAHAKIE